MKYNTVNINVRVGSFIRRHRILLGISGKSLGKKLNLSQQHISRLERGQTNFTIEIILYLLNELDKTIFDLVTEVFYEDPGEILTEYQRQQQFNTELTLIN
ncbi:helix-turn-helix domain-containing protein [Proteus mirabilis]|uniref:helix-turn-helix domain-containing protein n=1 Tax=Proteus mirabilis TaxID=584 RepID=UPI0025570B82|nr:helix-turn-helix transcriptional regulator [Proteus mirabilis]MDK6973665.1 helix-turn-helix transcriptional regulator [Proteus mirabilis]